MSSNEKIHGSRSSGYVHGDVFTLPEVVCFMLDKVGYTSERNLLDVSILEPSCGDGEFVVEIAKRLKQSAVKHHFDASDAFRRNVRAYDIDAGKTAVCIERVRQLGIEAEESIITYDFLKADVEKTDIVVGNPPYIRYENIPPEMIGYCKMAFATFHYRSDIYVPFFEKSLSCLKPGGVHCFICSDRWLNNEYGRKLRQLISLSYRLQLLVDMEQADAFQEKVSAYTAITLISAEMPSGVFEYSECKNVSELNALTKERKVMPTGNDWAHAFMGASPDVSLRSIERQGFNIGIGVATGADAVFVSDGLADEVEKELLLPAINARDLRGDKMQWQRKYLLNPYKVEGGLIDLEQYPRGKSYLERHRDQLAGRYVAKRSPAHWYRTIDRIVPSLLSQPKILLPDMSGNSFIFIDKGQFYPLHNIYYITGHTVFELQILAAMLMSDFVRDQLASVTNKMNGGFVRWQSQHLRKLLLPDIKSLSAHDAQALLCSYNQKNINAINVIIGKIVGKSQRKIVNAKTPLPVTA